MKKTFIQNYMEFTSGNECHENFHLYSCLVALSSLVSHRVWIDLGYFKVYPNLYVVLLGSAGGRKTTAMSTCKKLLRHINGKNQETPKVPFSAECQTKESLVQEMAANQRSFEYTDDSGEKVKELYAPMTVCVTELSQFFGVNSAHMVDFLTTVYDQDVYELKTKNKGSQLILGPHLTLLGCTVPDWVTARLKDDVISGGFSRRAIFVYVTDESKRVAFPHITPSMQKAWDQVIEYAHKLTTMSGEFQWGEGAKEFYTKWYEKDMKIPETDNTSGYYRSKHIQLLKIAMLVSAAEDTKLLLTLEHIQIALGLLEKIEENLGKVFAGIGRNELSAPAERVVAYIQSNGIKLEHGNDVFHSAVKEKSLKNFMYREVSTNEYIEIMRHLQDIDRIKKIKVKLKGEPKPYFYYAMPNGT